VPLASLTNVVTIFTFRRQFLGLIEALVPKGVYTSAYLNSPISESRLFQSNHQTTPDQCWGIVCLIDSSDPSLNLASILDVLVQFEKRISVGPGEALRTVRDLFLLFLPLVIAHIIL
jgi:hypothetical protein